MTEFDYASRMKRYQEHIRKAGAIAALVIRPSNVRYLLGFRGYANRPEYSEPRRLICLVIPADGQPLLVVPKIEFSLARQTLANRGIEIRRHFELKSPSETDDAWGIVRQYFKELGKGSGKILADLEYLTVRAHRAMLDGLQDFDVVSDGYEIENMRMIKDAEEQIALRQSGKVAVGMFQAEVESIRRGNREFEVALVGWDYVVRECARYLDGNNLESPIAEAAQLICSGERLSMPHAIASGRGIGPNDVVQLDFCRIPFVAGYRIGFGRIVSLRKLSSDEADMEAAVQKAYKVGLSMLRPGVKCAEIDTATRAVLQEAGLSDYVLHRSGRGIGVDGIESPEIKEGSEGVLKAGMAVSIEPGVWLEKFASRVENSFLITESGSELLTSVPPEMMVLS